MGGRKITAAFAVLAALAVLDAVIGPARPGDPAFQEILFGIRLPRILTAILAGSALAISGAQMQAVFRNPLADPHIMGVSGGAGLGAAIATLAIGSTAGTFIFISTALSAFLGALAVSLLISAAAGRTRNSGTLLLFGVMTGFICSAFTSILEFTADEESLKQYFNWSAGSFSNSRGGGIAVMAACSLIAMAIALINRKGLDIILFGDEYSRMSGAPVKRIRILAIVSCCLATGAVTSICGPVGFVGIVAPHAARWMSGKAVHGTVLPFCAVSGAIITVTADILSQSLGTPIPVGSTTALIGIPVIMYILFHRNAQTQ